MRHAEYVKYFNDCLDKKKVPNMPVEMFDDWQEICDTLTKIVDNMHRTLKFLMLNYNFGEFDAAKIDAIDKAMNCLDNATRKKQTIYAQFNQVQMNIKNLIDQDKPKIKIKVKNN